MPPAQQRRAALACEQRDALGQPRCTNQGGVHTQVRSARARRESASPGFEPFVPWRTARERELRANCLERAHLSMVGRGDQQRKGRTGGACLEAGARARAAVARRPTAPPRAAASRSRRRRRSEARRSCCRPTPRPRRPTATRPISARRRRPRRHAAARAAVRQSRWRGGRARAAPPTRGERRAPPRRAPARARSPRACAPRRRRAAAPRGRRGTAARRPRPWPATASRGGGSRPSPHRSEQARAPTP